MGGYRTIVRGEISRKYKIQRFAFENINRVWKCIRLSERFLSFYKEIIDAQCFLFYISLLNYART